MMEKINNNKEIFADLKDALDFANAEATNFGYKFDEETGILTVEKYADWDGFGEEPKPKETQFRLVGVRD